MTHILKLLGFPEPEQRDSVRFYFAKNLPYNNRIMIAVALLVVGFAGQMIFLKAWIGLPCLIAAVGLVMVKGYDSRARLKAFTLDQNWTGVTMDKLRDLERLRKRTDKWDRDALDVSNGLGVFNFIMLGLATAGVAVLMFFLTSDLSISKIIVVDAAVLIIPMWFTGMRFILKQPNLAIRTKIIMSMHRAFEEMKAEGEEFKPALMLSRGDDGKTVPVDARFTIAFPIMPEGFYGLQAQINVNVVQGRSYPYFYCVLASKPGFGLSTYQHKLLPTKGIIVEYQEDTKAEVLVIRQRTTKKSGYHTGMRKCSQILKVALDGGRLVSRS
ncbi:hypothetical protein ACFLU6_05340 [Acidobacteriota bacterium]